jgi:UDP-N-acetylglucosamine--N-acetylmuramyl-(pentapeptide) pyrophosphoryl-undecaprenol N-acetylglucosamine transferase
LRILFSGGGTAGHINPALAIARYAADKDKNTEILFVGACGGMEEKLVPLAGFEMKCVPVMGLPRAISLDAAKAAAKFISAYKKAREIIKDFHPDVVIGTGGYVCAPVIYAASRMKIPTIIHEQNVYPGLTVRMLAPRVDITAISFEDTEKYLKNPKKVQLTGNPVRSGILKARRLKEGGEPLVLISGGSLGAGSINRALIELLATPGQEYYGIIASTGERNYDDVMAEIKKRGITPGKNKVILPYIFDMDKKLAMADIAVTRAGAITVSELCAIGKPAIIIPSPNVVNDHQTHNARFMESRGAAVVIKEEELTGQLLAGQIKTLLSNPSALRKMSCAGLANAITTAAETIYDAAVELTKQ